MNFVDRIACQPQGAMDELTSSDAKEPIFKLRKRMAEQGYLLVRNFFDRELINKARLEAIEALHSIGWLSKDRARNDARMRQGLSPSGVENNLNRLISIWKKKKTFDSLSGHPALMRFLNKLAGRRLIKHPFGYAQWGRAQFPSNFLPAMFPHQDGYFIRQPGVMTSVWIPMGHCPRYLGGLALVPRSHKLGYLEHDKYRAVDLDTRKFEWRCSDYEAGDVLMFSSHMIHAPLPNRTCDTIRLAMDFRYCPRDFFDSRMLKAV